MRYYINGEDVDHLKMWAICEGNLVVCPTEVQSVLPILTTAEYIRLCYMLIDISDCYILPRDWEKTKIGKMELQYAKATGKKIRYESKQWALEREKGVELWKE